jgi:hypothetical protein
LIDAIGVTAGAGMTETDLETLVPALKRRHGEGWRDPFWRGQIHAAGLRAEAGAAVRPLIGPGVGDANASERRQLASESEVNEEVNAVREAPSPSDRERAESLAAMVTVPVELPRRLDGSRLDRLSTSSLTKFLKCPEEWRRHYLCRERFPSTPAMALGSIVDTTVGHLVVAVMEGHKPPSGRDLLELHADDRSRYLARNEVAWTEAEPSALVERIGRDAIALFAARILPTISRPIAVQRNFRFKLAPQASWAVVGAIDVEEPTRVRDTKVKSKSLYGRDVEGDVQASTYLLARMLEQRVAEEFVWDIILKPGKQRRAISWTQVPARRTARQLRSTLVRYAAAARRMAALEAAFGPDEPWDFADPRHALCSDRYCSFFASCPGGGGLADVERADIELVPTTPVAVELPDLSRQIDDFVVPAPPDPQGLLVDEPPA